MQGFLHDTVPGPLLRRGSSWHVHYQRQHSVHLSGRRLCFSLCRRLVWGTLHRRPLIPHDLRRGAGLPDV